MKRIWNNRPIVAIATLILATCANELFAASPPTIAGLRTVALSTDSFPGVPAGTTIDQFDYPRLDALGKVAFQTRLLDGPGGVVFGTDSAIWSESAPGVLQYVARSGDPVPGLNYLFSDVEPGGNLHMSAGGEVYFISGIHSTTSPTPSSSGIFEYSPSTGFRVRAVSSPIGVSIPTAGVAGDYFSNFSDFNEAGDLVMQTGSGFGPISALDSGGLFKLSGGSFPMINDAHDVTYRAIDNNNVRRIDVWNRIAPVTRTGTRTVVSQNQLAPGTGGALFLSFADQNTFANVAGRVSFIASLTGANVTDDNDFGIWSETAPGKALALDLREGQQAPGIAPGVIFAGFDRFSNPVTFGSGGGVALRLGLTGANVDSTNDRGVWAGPSAADLHLVARKGDQAPGVEPGLVFSQFDMAGVTRDGRGIFQAFLSGPGLDSDRDRGYWGEGADGLLHLIARRGDFVQLPTGEITQLLSVQLDTQVGINDLGQVAFIGYMSNGRSGVFVSSLLAVPEPSTVLQAIAGLSAFAVIRSSARRRLFWAIVI